MKRGLTKSIGAMIAIASIVTTAVGTMHSTFKWFERKYGNKKDYSRPIIKGA